MALSYTEAQIDAFLAEIDSLSDELQSLTDAEIQQLQNIGTEAISATEWGYLAELDQALTTSDNVVFNSLNSINSTELSQLTNIDTTTISSTQWGYLGALDQSLVTTAAVTFATVNTGQGDNELYDMDQNVLTTSSPTFVALDTDKIISDSFSIKDAADSETLATFVKDGAVSLYYDNTKMIETASYGVLITTATDPTVGGLRLSGITTGGEDSLISGIDFYNRDASGDSPNIGAYIRVLSAGSTNRATYLSFGADNQDVDGEGTIAAEVARMALSFNGTGGAFRVGDTAAAIDFGGGTLDWRDCGIVNINSTSGSDANIAEKPNLYIERTANGTDGDLALGWGNDNQEAMVVFHGKVGDDSENGLTGFVSKVQSYQANNASTGDSATLHGGLIVAEMVTKTGYTNRHLFGLGIQSVLTSSDGTLASGQNVVCIEADVNIDQDLDGGTIGSPTYNATGFWAQAASSGNPTAAFRATYNTTGYWGYGLLLNTYFTKCGIYLKNGNADVQAMYLETNYANNFVAKFVNEGNNANRYGLEIQAGADDGSGTTYYIQALDGDGDAVGYLQHSGDFSAVNPSDARIKSKIRKTKIKGLNIINAIPIKDYVKRGHELTGFVAQDVLPVWPQAVSEDPKGMLGLSREALVIPLAKAIQELDDKVEKMLKKKKKKGKQSVRKKI
jgi:hypothetical protein